MSPTLRKQINIPNICDVNCLRKFKELLSQSFVTHEQRTLPNNMSFKAKLQKVGLTNEVHVEVFTNNSVAIAASPRIGISFNEICTTVENLLKEANSSVSRQNVVRINRAKEILDYVRVIQLDDEVGKMITVVLCDIIQDLLVTEKLSKFTHTRQDLENESVGVKLDLLRNRYNVPIYREKAIRDIRDLRNKIAHGGAHVSRDEAIFAREAIDDIFALL